MGPLQPRTASVPITTFTAIVVVLVLWILALLAIIMYLFLRWRKHAQRPQRTISFNQSASFDHTAPHVPPGGSTALTSYPQRAPTPSYPQRAQTTPSYPPLGPSPLSETTSLPDLRPVRSSFDPVSPVNSTRIEDSSHITTVSPTKTPISAAPSSNQARLQVSHAGTPSQAANSARLQPMRPTSDITDISADTVDPHRQVVNPGYMAMLAQRGIRVSDHALLGSDDSTDAGASPRIGLSYADRVRGMSARGASIDVERGRGRPAGHGRGGRIMTFGRDVADDGLGRPVVPLHVRKMASM